MKMWMGLPGNKNKEKKDQQDIDSSAGIAGSRVISLKGAQNVRDFGGLKVSDGRTILPHMFLRSAALHNLTAQDIDLLRNRYDLSMVIDLRTDDESRQKPDPCMDGVTNHHISLLKGALGGISHEEETEITIEKVDMDMSKMYRELVSDPYSIAQMREVFALIMENVLCENGIDGHENGSILWHCSGGKDRCGLISAFLLYILGASKKTIFEDYLMTNVDALPIAKKYYWLALLKKRNKETAMKIYKMCVADKYYLMAALDEIHKRYSSLDDFTEEQLGVTPLMREALRERVLF